jgi:hypothetical protein
MTFSHFLIAEIDRVFQGSQLQIKLIRVLDFDAQKEIDLLEGDALDLDFLQSEGGLFQKQAEARGQQE